MKTIKRILIANRAEIAHRIAKTIERLGMEAIHVYSDADRETLTIECSHEAHRLGRAPVEDSYLNQKKIIDLALIIKADAIHPGYGLLSENSEFAREVMNAGLIWIGPTPESMDRVASKSAAKEVAEKANVPTLGGHRGDQKIVNFIEAAKKIGYPVLLKATAGGGGRGIRKVFSDEELKKQIEQARSEAKNSFGNDEILLEKYVSEAYHVEVQVFGDDHGNVIHLGERDCSAQRRNQKVIEESPSPIVTPELRKEITEAAVRLAKEAKYTNAGTVEFLVTPQKEFFFLEMNTRLQVEHPVTELVTGLDLVEWQIRIARGEKLPLTQDKVKFSGHSIQARLYAEDPFDNYLPQTGRITGFHFPDNARVDHFLSHRTEITPYYDSMLAKIIVHASTRKEAMQKLIKALEETLIGHLKTNQIFLKQILETKEFQAAKLFTSSLDKMKWELPSLSQEEVKEALRLAAQVVLSETAKDNQHLLDDWTNSTGRKSLLALQLEKHREIVNAGNLPETNMIKPYLYDGGEVQFYWKKKYVIVRDQLTSTASAEVTIDPSSIIAPMDGTLIKLYVKVGDEVKPGQVLAVMEAMKMQMELKSSVAGKIKEITSSEKTLVRNKQTIIKLSPKE
jgi:geranyl-CoA carboxylase alpha subunit